MCIRDRFIVSSTILFFSFSVNTINACFMAKHAKNLCRDCAKIKKAAAEDKKVFFLGVDVAPPQPSPGKIQ